MTKWNLLALMLGLLLVAAPVSRVFAEEDEYGDDGDDDEEPKGGDDSEKDVVVLTSKNFEEKLKSAKYALVEFYAPWCGHCKTLAPHYAKAATILKEKSPDTIIAKVDATEEAELGQKFEVKGYPTLKWFVDGELAGDYGGGRDTEGIVKWVAKKTGPATVVVESVDQLKELEASNGVLVAGYFAKAEGKEYDEFKSAAQKTEDPVFVETTSAEVAAAIGIAKAPGVAAVKNFKGEEREVVPLTGDITAEDVKAFAIGEKLPLTIEFNNENSEKIFNSGISKQVIFWSKAADFAEDSEVFKTLKAVSKKFKGKLVFVTVNNEGETHEPVTNYFGLKDATSPTVIGFYMEKNKKFKLKEEITEAALEAFAQSVFDGTAEPEYKSAPIPEEATDADGVTTVVGKSVDAIVLDASKDVLLEIYAPWCGHCKKLEPIYKKLGKRFKKVDSVVIAKMDGTENEHPSIEVKGFPTIMFFPAGEGKTPVVFEGGDRSLKALTKFIKKNAKVAYELPKKAGDKEEAEEAAAEKASEKDEL